MSNIALEAKTKEHKLLKSYLEANASECLIEKINNGVKIEKDGKTLINKKTLETFMAFATEEAKKQAEKGERVAMVEDAVVFGWLIHYFEESSIEGILYNEDGTEYKKPVPVKKPTAKPEVKIEPKPPVKKQGEVISMFEGLDDIFMTDKEEIEPVEEEAEEIEVEEPIKEKPKGSPVYQRYMSIQEMYPDRIIIYRMGDFFEVFGDNAKILANELELTLTGRDMGLDERVAMVGYPYHKERDYLNRILKKYSVAIVSGNDILLEGKKEPVPTVIDVDKSTGEIIEPPDFNMEIAAKLLEIFGNDLEGY